MNHVALSLIESLKNDVTDELTWLALADHLEEYGDDENAARARAVPAVLKWKAPEIYENTGSWTHEDNMHTKYPRSRYKTWALPVWLFWLLPEHGGRYKGYWAEYKGGADAALKARDAALVRFAKEACRVEQ